MQLPLVGAKVLVGIDFSDGCERALQRAVTLAEPSQAPIQLVHVVEWPSHPVFPQERNATSQSDTASSHLMALASHTQALLGRLGHVCSYIVADRVPARIYVYIGDPAARLLLAAEQSGATIIVIGAQGRSESLRAMRGALGSTAERMSATSRIPILLAACPERLGVPG